MDHAIFTSSALPREVARSLPPDERATLAHMQDVKHFAVKIGREMGYEPYEITLLKIAAQWHDISKFLPQLRPLFRKPERLTKKERAKTKKHAYWSAVILQHPDYWSRFIPHYEMTRPIAIQVGGHHWPYSESEQRYLEMTVKPDFAYPAEGFEDLGVFPLEGARIIKVADCFVTAMERRHYPKRVLTRREAYEDIAMGAGVEYDPLAVEALKKVLTRPSVQDIVSRLVIL